MPARSRHHRYAEGRFRLLRSVRELRMQDALDTAGDLARRFRRRRDDPLHRLGGSWPRVTSVFATSARKSGSPSSASKAARSAAARSAGTPGGPMIDWPTSAPAVRMPVRRRVLGEAEFDRGRHVRQFRLALARGLIENADEVAAQPVLFAPLQRVPRRLHGIHFAALQGQHSLRRTGEAGDQLDRVPASALSNRG